MVKLVNLTPHSIDLLVKDADGRDVTITIPPSGTVARCTVTRRVAYVIETVEGFTIPVNRTSFGQVEGLPEPEDGTVYIVSSLVAQAVPDRDDVLIVDDTVRDEQGRIVGAKALAYI